MLKSVLSLWSEGNNKNLGGPGTLLSVTYQEGHLLVYLEIKPPTTRLNNDQYKLCKKTKASLA